MVTMTAALTGPEFTETALALMRTGSTAAEFIKMAPVLMRAVMTVMVMTRMVMTGTVLTLTTSTGRAMTGTVLTFTMSTERVMTAVGSPTEVSIEMEPFLMTKGSTSLDSTALGSIAMVSTKGAFIVTEAVTTKKVLPKKDINIRDCGNNLEQTLDSSA